MGYEAVKLLAEGKTRRVMAMQGDEYVNYDITEALAMKKTFQMDRYQILEALTNSCGPDF